MDVAGCSRCQVCACCSRRIWWSLFCHLENSVPPSSTGQGGSPSPPHGARSDHLHSALPSAFCQPQEIKAHKTGFPLGVETLYNKLSQTGLADSAGSNTQRFRPSWMWRKGNMGWHNCAPEAAQFVPFHDNSNGVKNVDF